MLFNSSTKVFSFHCVVYSIVLLGTIFSVLVLGQFDYPALSVVQLRFLRLQSNRAEQRVTYSCYPGQRLGQTQRQVQFLTDAVKQSYLGALQDCVVCSVWHLNVKTPLIVVIPFKIF